MLQFWLAAVYSAAALGSAVTAVSPYDAQAQTIVDGLSVNQVIGQMAQLDLSLIMDRSTRTLNETAVRSYAQLCVGSYLNTFWDGPINGRYGFTASEFRAIIQRVQEITIQENNCPPIFYGIDSVHGANYISGAVLMPHQINSGASFNPDLVYEASRITARDTESAGVSMIFGPILDISRNKLWARTYETFGEDPHLSSVMGVSVVRGLQSYNQTAACLKHFIAYSYTPTGQDRDNVVVSDFQLVNDFLPPFKAAIDAGALSVMETYSSLDGVPVVANTRILNDLLRSDLGFNGVLLSDWNEVYNLNAFHRVSATREEAVATSLMQTSLDISMMDTGMEFFRYVSNLLQKHPEQEARLRQSVKRIIEMKLRLNLLEIPVPGAEFVSMVGNDKDKETALEMARESIVLLKNDNNVLPLPKNASVLLTGPSADNVGYQCGGWTQRWQGYTGNEMFPNGISIRKGLENVAGNGFTYYNGLQIDGSITDANMTQTLQLARQHQYTVVTIGEINYTEKLGDTNDLALPDGMERFIEALADTGTSVIVILIEGRPRLLGSIPDHAAAIIYGMLPCELGGQAIAEILYGDVNPSGKLPISYPKYAAIVDVPYYHTVSTRCSYDNCQMQWDFGAGLSYTQFNYSPVTLDKTNITDAGDKLTATVTVTNVGSRVGKETVMLFLIQPFRKISVPEMKLLKKFSKIELQPGESRDVSFTLSMEDWGVYKPEIGSGLQRIVEDSNYVVAIKPDTQCDVYVNITNPLCATFTINTSGVTGL